MNWQEDISKAIDYIEEHLTDKLKIEDVCNHVYASSYYFQRGFRIFTGYTISEYIRNRRLYEAALDIIQGDEKIIEIAYKYDYDTPESFTKAFTRFHGNTPILVRKIKKVKVFLPLKVKIEIYGGHKVKELQENLKIEKLPTFKVIGFARTFDFETAYLEIPKFWNEVFMKYLQPIFSFGTFKNAIEQAVLENKIGEFGVCIDEGKDGKFKYIIAGGYTGGPIPKEMELFEFPELEWAKFKVIGPMPKSLQDVNTKIFRDWLPSNPDYKIAKGYNIEWYSEKGKTTDMDYESAIWIPVAKR
jgi:hypothetical protein